jgi:hypothetical protein
MKTLLEDKYLYVFGNRVAVKKWKQHHSTTKGTPRKNDNEHPTEDEPRIKESAETTHHPTTANTTPSAPAKTNTLLEEARNAMLNLNPNNPLNTPTPATRANPPRRPKVIELLEHSKLRGTHAQRNATPHQHKRTTHERSTTNCTMQTKPATPSFPSPFSLRQGGAASAKPERPREVPSSGF